MLTADAFGVLPPIARLSPEGAMYHFLSGYTAKVAGTEKGVKDPAATFSTCFGAPFLPLNPNVYARGLGERIARTRRGSGWSTPAGPAARSASGKRMKIAHTRAMITRGALRRARRRRRISGIRSSISTCRRAVPDVPAEVLDPRSTWTDKAAYDAQAKKLAAMFVENFKTFEGDVDAAVVEAGPRRVSQLPVSQLPVDAARTLTLNRRLRLSLLPCPTKPSSVSRFTRSC